MTELYACTDCGAEVDFDARREHMKAEHGVNYTIPDPVCACREEPCARAKALEGANATT